MTDLSERAMDELIPLPWEAKRKLRPLPKPKHPSIWELRDNSCRWPLGNDVPYQFCGADKQPGRPYCADHTRIAYKKGYV